MNVTVPYPEYRQLADAAAAVARIRGFLNMPLNEHDNPVKMLAHIRDIVNPCETCGGTGSYEGTIDNRFGGGAEDVLLACPNGCVVPLDESGESDLERDRRTA